MTSLSSIGSGSHAGSMHRGLDLEARALQSIARNGVNPQNIIMLIQGQRTTEAEVVAQTTSDNKAGTLLNVMA